MNLFFKPTINISFIKSQWPEHHQLIKQCSSLQMVLVCQSPSKKEGVYDGNNWPTNGRRAVKVPSDTDWIGGAQHPVGNTPRHHTCRNFSFAFQNFKGDSQHVTLREVNSLKTETIDILPVIDKVRVPVGPKGINRADVIIFSNSGG